MKKDEYYMDLAIVLAKKGGGNVNPNPQVGCFGIPCTDAGAAVSPGRQTGFSLSPYRRAKVFFFLLLDWEALHQLKPEQLVV